MRIRASNLRSLMGKLHARLSKLHSTCRNEQFEKKSVMGKNVYCFYHFWNLIKICSEFLRRSFGTVFKTAFHVYRWSSRERRTNLLNNTKKFIFFWEFEGQIYKVWWGSFMHGCQNCILHVRRNNSRKNWCWGKKVTVFITFEIYSKYVRRFCEKVRHGGQNCIPRLQMILHRKKNKSLE